MRFGGKIPAEGLKGEIHAEKQVFMKTSDTPGKVKQNWESFKKLEQGLYSLFPIIQKLLRGLKNPRFCNQGLNDILVFRGHLLVQLKIESFLLSWPKILQDLGLPAGSRPFKRIPTLFTSF